MTSLWFLLALIVTIFFIYILLNHFIKHHHRASIKFPLPPGGTGWPLIGETFDYFAMIRKGIPEWFVRDRITKHSSKVFKTSLFGEPMVMFGDAEGNKLFLYNEGGKFKDWYPKSLDKILPISGGETLENMVSKTRHTIHPLLRGDSFHGHVPTLDIVVKQHLESYWDGKKDFINVSEVFPILNVTIACRLIFSIQDPDVAKAMNKRIRDVGKGLFSLPLNIPGTPFHRGVKASESIRKDIEEIIKQKRIELLKNKNNGFPTKDVVSNALLANGNNGNYIGDFDMASMMLGILHGAYNTINLAFTSMMIYLTELPDVWDKVMKEQMEIARRKEPNQLLNWDDICKMKYSWHFACEVMRLHPSSSSGSFREVAKDFVHNGYTIPKGWKVHWFPDSTHKDPEYFPDPYKFDPSRFEGKGPTPYTFVPFGGGPHMCPGNTFARLAILVLIHNVVTKYAWERVPNEKMGTNLQERSIQDLLIRVHPRNP